jgi:hypothetical protein
MSSLCQYKDIFGKPNTGLHSYRFLGIAFVDVFFTLIGAILLSKLDVFKKYPWYYIFIALVVIGELFHLAFCVKTPITSLFI